MKRYLFLFQLLFMALATQALPKLPVIFSDNMVMQQNTIAKIWGTARPKHKVHVKTTWGAEQTVISDEKGNWTASLATGKAGGPYSITISDGKTITLNNVMLGEVWLCSGQSNMEFPVKGWAQVLNADEEVAQASHPDIRLMQIHKVSALQPTGKVVANSATWQVCSPSTISEFSAVAYFFARQLTQKLHVPVGVIDATWGGSNIESWISKETLSQLPYMKNVLEHLSEPTDRNTPTSLFNGMIDPLIPMAMRGVIWYQGEQNEQRGYEYRDLFTMLIRDWRNAWQQDFPFYFVQLANFHERHHEPVEAEWAEMREAQDMALHLDHTGMVVTMDVGQGDNVHYPNKQEVGRRLALQALAKTYGEKVVCDGPRFAGYKINRDTVMVDFSHAYGGLKAKNGRLTQFTIAGPDHVWHNAQAEIVDSGHVAVWSDRVIMPVAVRYAWQDNPDADLFNGEGLPAASFRTDDWQGMTYGKNRTNTDH
jgi:sialate O-acetylesterase